MNEPNQLDLRFVVPPSNENRWSDLLATLILNDPAPFQEALGVEFDGVRREVTIPAVSGRKSDRLDLLLLRDGQPVVAIEAKVLSDLGAQQLERYETAFPTASEYRVLHLERLPLHLPHASTWKSLTWESVLGAYAMSPNRWVSDTARSWREQLNLLVPVVDGSTIWNDVPSDAAGFELALRSRIAWLANQMDSWCDLEHDFVQSSGGGNWAVRMWAATGVQGHRLTVELQEGLSAYAWKVDRQRPYRDRLPGPVVLVGLYQSAVTTSAGFDWNLLQQLFSRHVYDESGKPRDDRGWHLTPARPKDPIDRQNWEGIVSRGAPRWVGKGWGNRVAKSVGACLFGARYGISPSSTLSEIDEELREVRKLVGRMTQDDGHLRVRAD